MSDDCCRLINESLSLKVPIGWLHIQGDKEYVQSISFETLKKKSKTSNSSAVAQAGDELKKYFEGNLLDFDFPFMLAGTEFQNKVWAQLLKIPYGATTSYSAIAEKLKKSGSQRAVGMANNRNRLPIVIPCHRVISKAGHLHGYAGGLKIKKWLLDHEAAISKAILSENISERKRYG